MEVPYRTKAGRESSGVRLGETAMRNVEIMDRVRQVRAGSWKVDVSQGERNGQVSSEWFNRPDDERYLSLDNL